MNTITYKLPLSFDQIVELIRQLPKKEKISLSRELEKDLINSKLSELLNAFKTNELSFSVITNEVLKERRKRYASK